ncbi:MAG: OmpA family protein [Sinimarinibacterium sp.]|jgi:outer membrane protein OmpA-like peptidoglycan-associated protein
MNAAMRVAAALALLCTAGAVAAEDAEGCKDHPLFNRIKGYGLSECSSQGFDEGRFPVGEAHVDRDPSFTYETVEGPKSELGYYTLEGEQPASALQVVRNFQNAAKAAGGSVLGEYRHDPFDLSQIGGGERATTIRLKQGNREVFALVRASSEGTYHLTIVEREAMQQEIVANALLDKINQAGFVAIDVRFDTGKATIKPESSKLLDEVATALKSAAALRLEVAGHTDNVGGAAANQTLSEARAQSVVAALVARGIAADRLTPRGYGQTRPVAPNTTEDGRAANRRVELVKR